MKKQLFFLLTFLAASSAVFAQGKLTVKQTTYNFGKVAQGKPVTAEFVLTNTGNAPVVINNATASCGCTTPLYSKDPVQPGKSTIVKATYNAATMGAFNKSVTVYSNAENSNLALTLTGEVVEASKAVQTSSTKAAPMKARKKTAVAGR